MQAKLTHEEACKLVDNAIERCYNTLMYIRLKLSQSNSQNLSLFEQNTVEQVNLLCNINWYGAYLHGAQAMARALEDWDLLDFPKKKTGHGSYAAITIQRANPIINKAIYDLFLSSSRNLEYCLNGLPSNMEIQYDVQRNKKGKVIEAKARFVKKVIKYEEI